MSLKQRITKKAWTTALVLTTSVAPMAFGTVATTGCGRVFGSSGPSKVGQGQKYVSGDPNFDQFFSQLYEMQIGLGTAPGEEKEIRSSLAKELKGDPDASATLLAKRVEKRAKELAEAGTGLKLEVEGLDSGEEASAKMSTAGKELEGDGKSFAQAVENAAAAEAKLAARMRKARRELDRLQSVSLALDGQIDSAFRLGGPSKKSEVRSNLKDARTLIPLMAARADEVAESAKTMAKKLVDACATDDGSFDAPPPPPPPPEEPPPDENGTTKPGGTKPGGTKPGGTKPPKPPAEPGGTKPPPPPPPTPPSDFEP